ncbi:primase-helicase family protein [Bradyrhizobium genosp. P]|uniref:primase-helicase family protein n=1 Tax=Bradyrhizobium genosp. P TaxID=83641 RepID=UPI003CF04344
MGVRDKGISPELCLALMLEYYSPRCIPPWDAEGLEIKVKNAYSYASQSRGGDRTAELDFEEDRDFDSSAIVPFGDPKDIAKQKRARTKARKAEAEKPEGQKAQTDWSKAKFIEQFVYVGGDFDRFLKKADPRIRWKRGVIDAHFKFLFSKGKVSDNMLSNKTGTVARYECVGYKPGAGQDLEGGRMFNLYRPSSVIPKEGDISWWQDHLAFLFPDELDRRMLTNWLAWFVQNLDKKPKHALLIQGRIQGTGKSFISNMLTKIIGEHNQSVVSQGALRGDFNGYAMRAKLLVIEELRAVERNEVKTALHDIITEERITINEKGIPRFNMENFFGLIAMTNEDAAISLDLSDRRYLVLRTDAMKRTPEYYDALYAKLRDPEAIAAVAHHLMTHDCGNYSGAAAAPVTEAKGDMILAGAGDHARYIEENIGTWPSVMTLPEIRELLQRANIKVGDRAIGKALEILDAVKWGKKRGSDSIRPFGRNGRKLYPWLLGEAAAKAKAGKKFTESEVIGMYLASHSVTGETKHTAAGIVADNDDDLADLLGADAPSTRRPTLN